MCSGGWLLYTLSASPITHPIRCACQREGTPSEYESWRANVLKWNSSCIFVDFNDFCLPSAHVWNKCMNNYAFVWIMYDERRLDGFILLHIKPLVYGLEWRSAAVECFNSMYQFCAIKSRTIMTQSGCAFLSLAIGERQRLLSTHICMEWKIIRCAYLLNVIRFNTTLFKHSIRRIRTNIIQFVQTIRYIN